MIIHNATLVSKLCSRKQIRRRLVQNSSMGMVMGMIIEHGVIVAVNGNIRWSIHLHCYFIRGNVIIIRTNIPLTNSFHNKGVEGKRIIITISIEEFKSSAPLMISSIYSSSNLHLMTLFRSESTHGTSGLGRCFCHHSWFRKYAEWGLQHRVRGSTLIIRRITPLISFSLQNLDFFLFLKFEAAGSLCM